jgi:4-amino-4-deoxy-L-arabinose transferase-like glycosyltransferase
VIPRRYLFLPVPALFYLLTTAPGIGHADQAILIDQMQRGQLGAGATHHNFTVLAGYLLSRVLPFGELAYRCNLVSALFGAAAVMVFYLVALRVAGSATVAALSALFLMTSHSVWWHATLAESYAANALFCCTILGGLVRFEQTGRVRWLDGAAVAAGLAIFNHAQMGMWTPALLLVTLVSARRGTRPVWAALLRTSAFYLAGLVPYLAVLLRDASRFGGLHAAGHEALGGPFTDVFMQVWPPRLLLQSAAGTGRLLLVQWGWPPVFLGLLALGVWRAWRSTELELTHAGLRVAFLLNTLFFAFYPTWDQFAFLMPSFLLLNHFGTLGLAWLWRGSAGRPWLAAGLVAASALTLAHTIRFYESLPERAVGSSLWSTYATAPSAVNTMFDGRFLADPNKRDFRSIQDFAEAAFERLPPGSMLVDQIARTYFQLTLYYQRWLGRRPDLEIALHVPTGQDPARWSSGLTRDQLIGRVLAAPSLEGVFFTSLHGSEEVVRELARSGVTFLAHPLRGDASVFQARAASDVDFRPWLHSLQAADAALRIRFKRHNPPLRLRLAWLSADAVPLPRSEAVYDVPFDVPPLLARPPAPGLPPGSWIARVYCFDQLVATAPVVVQ